MGRALLVVVIMVAITALLCLVIYGVMIAIRPIEPREYKKVSDVGLSAARVVVSLSPAPDPDAPFAARARAQLSRPPTYTA